MEIRFYVQYVTNYGDDIQLSYFDDNGVQHRLQMNYLNNEFWEGVLNTNEIGVAEHFNYSYVRRHYTTDVEFLKMGYSLNLKKLKGGTIKVTDEWRNDSTLPKVFGTRPFEQLIHKHKEKGSKKASAKPFTHLYKIKGFPLPSGFSYCILGSDKEMGNWNKEKPTILTQTKNNWVGKLNLKKADYPIRYKIGICEDQSGTVQSFEDGADRVLHGLDNADINVIHILANFSDIKWKAAGINVPVSALKTKNSWGIGEFTDLVPLVDLCKKTGLKLIQLLPVNDTTATHTNKDSYPYSAITAFGLHPAYLNVQQLAKALGIKLSKEFMDKVEHLNSQPSLHYEEALSIKMQVAKELYQKEKEFFKDDLNWFEFFDIHRHWLQPYAVFCSLRDKYNTADFNQWGENAVYSEELVQQLSDPTSKDYDAVALHYFIQYYLFQQLQEAVSYAHSNDVAIKADLPIGVGRHSVDTWMAPHLFNMDQQAGAPPDAFAVKGQNWSFPTYNWHEMSKDNYAWWRQRMEQLSTYADAVRIDHVLGFFRIWSIPTYAKEGILGRFVPAYGLKYYDFENEGFYFNEFRLCAPYFTEDILHQKFGDMAWWVKQTFLNGNTFKQEFDTQEKIDSFFTHNKDNAWAKQGLFDILADRILIKDEWGGYHFRINIFETNSFKHFSDKDRWVLDKLYNRYFFQMQDDMWKEEGIKKLSALMNASNNMLLCAEDLGMVPEMVPGVLEDLEIVTLQVERMPKKSTDEYALPAWANYTTVVTPSTHDMSTMREWWEEDTTASQKYFNNALGNFGASPFHCEPWLAKQILEKHLQSPAILAVFLLQDLLAMSEGLRRQNPLEERINIPADPNHFWNYRMHLNIDDITNDKEYCKELEKMVKVAGR